MYIRGKLVKTKVQKWGNSRAIRIPLALAEEGRFDPGCDVEIKLKGQELVVMHLRKKQSLRELLAHVTSENIHGETQTGTRIGGEIW